MYAIGTATTGVTTATQKGRQAAGTRARLLSIARQLFAERGFAATPTEEIVARAGVTRGALYYHFRNKEDLFSAVFEALQEEVAQRVTMAATAEPDPWAAVLSGCEAFLDAYLDPLLARITLIDGPAVLGWQKWRDIGFRHSFGLLVLGLHNAMGAGELEDQPVAPLAQVLLGALNEGALFVAMADDPATARAEVGAAVRQLLAGLQGRPGVAS